MTATKIELVYFPLRGRANLIRLILAHSGIQHTATVPDWPAYKPKTPFGQLPVLRQTSNDSNDFELSQSGAIVRYLARDAGLIPTDPQQAAFVESIVDAWADVRDLAIDAFFASESDKKKAVEKAVEATFQASAFHGKLLAKNASVGSFYVGESATIADLALFDVVDQIRRLDDTVLDRIDVKVKKVHDLVRQQFQTFIASPEFYDSAPI
jgi:glutathione S-transferase